MFYDSEFTMVDVFPEVMAAGQDSATVGGSKSYNGAGVRSEFFGSQVASLVAVGRRLIGFWRWKCRNY